VAISASQAKSCPRGLVEVLCAKGEPLNISEGSGRLDLAWFIASKDNPLTARVMVNRIWLHLMGQGIVTTPDNFGVMGIRSPRTPNCWIISPSASWKTAGR
jgi:hypothetical protein